ncbi:MAG: AAA family ATPase [Methylococcales bacterium]|nr:AAA family ATPase [Methylococcales bacterium]
MKILNLYFKNINSLEGESLIDFQKKPLVNAGVFAIIGPNGSGKSSILDAISLAFYGETFRFDRPADHVMTQNTAESFAQVEFLLADKKFRSRWQVNRKNNKVKGALLDPTMRLFALNKQGEELLAESLQTVTTTINEIMGMDFHSFSRSMLLAQGDFAAFLNGLDNERIDILEKMSSHDIYDEHKQQLITKKQQSEHALTQIKDDLDQLPLMSSIETEACAHDLLDFNEQLNDYRRQQNEAKVQLAWHQRIKSFEQQHAELNKKHAITREKTKLLQKKLQKINAVMDVVTFKDDVDTLDRQQKNYKQSQLDYDRSKRELKQLEKQQQQLTTQIDLRVIEGKNTVEQKKVIDDIRYQVKQKNVVLKTESSAIELIHKELTTHKNKHADVITWMTAHSADKTLLDGFPETKKLKQSRLTLAQLEKNYAAVEKQMLETQQLLEKKQATEHLSASNLLEMKQDLVNAEKKLAVMIQETPLIERQQQVDYQQKRVNGFKELYTLAKVNNQVTKKGFLGFFSAKKTAERLTIKQLEQQAAEITAQISEAQFLRNTLEKAIINETLLKKMQQHRVHLETDKPCPLCGSLEHPFIKNPPRESDSQQILKDQNIKLQILVIKADKLKKQIFNAEKRDKKEETNDNNLQLNNSQWHILSNKLNVAGHKMDIGNFSLMKDLLKKEEEDLSEFKQSLIVLQQQYLLIEKLNKQLVIEKEKISELKIALEQLSNQTEKIPQSLATLKVELETSVTNEKSLTDKTNTQLALLNEKMPLKNKDAQLTERLKIREQDYQAHQESEQQTAKKLTQLNEKLTDSQQKMAQLNEDILDNEKKLTHEESIGLHLTLLEKQGLIVDVEHESQKKQQQLETLEHALKDKLDTSQYSNLAALKEALVLVAEKETVEAQYANLQQQLEQMDTENAQLQERSEAEKNRAISSLNVAELEANTRALNEKISIANDEVRHLNDKQRSQTRLEQQQQLLSEKLQYQLQDFNESETNLRESNENGHVFRRRVQLKMATKLLSQTNTILEKISGRYYVRQAPSETGLALEIEDTNQQNSRRLPQSLSGGESFVVSLALALGLSELANNGKAMNTLFLDEGFGNLDSETLYTVVTTLQNLKAQGKIVGVISHVDGVKKRIKTRIEMIKKPNGLSKLRKIS